MNNNTLVFILAAGFGKRLMPLTKTIPKPLIDINGQTLLGNTINFFKSVGCKEFIINSHYKNKEIKNFLKKINEDNITLIYEKEILDTGGGVKNAINYTDKKNIIIVNSDIYWTKENMNDVKIFIESFYKNKKPHLLLSKKENAYGLVKNFGDFTINLKKIKRFKKNDKIMYYSGLQILSTDIFSIYNESKFSINKVWDDLISKQLLEGMVMKSKWYHVGDIQGLNIARNLYT